MTLSKICRKFKIKNLNRYQSEYHHKRNSSILVPITIIHNFNKTISLFTSIKKPQANKILILINKNIDNLILIT